MSTGASFYRQEHAWGPGPAWASLLVAWGWLAGLGRFCGLRHTLEFPFQEIHDDPRAPRRPEGSEAPCRNIDIDSRTQYGNDSKSARRRGSSESVGYSCWPRC